MSVASVTNKTLQLAELVISNEKFTGATGYVASSSTFSSSVNSTSLTVPEISATGDIKCATSSNSGTATIDTAGLTITRNVSNSLNEIDFVAINPTTVNGISFYASQTEVISTTLPILAISTTGIAVNGTCNASALGVVSGANSITLTSTSPATLAVGGTCNAEAFGIVDGANSVSLTSTAPGSLSVGGNVQCSAVGSGSLNLQSGAFTGALTTNAAGQLLWQGIVIS